MSISDLESTLNLMQRQQDKQAEQLSKIAEFMGRMEENARNREQSLAAMQTEMMDMRDSIDNTDSKLEDLGKKIAKWEAKLGAFMFVAGCLWAFFVVLKDHILAFIKG